MVTTVTSCILTIKWAKSAARFCHQVAALVPDMFWNFHLEKNHKIVHKSYTTKDRGNISTYLESFGVCLTKFKNNLILLNNITDNQATKWVKDPHWKTLLSLSLEFTLVQLIGTVSCLTDCWWVYHKNFLRTLTLLNSHFLAGSHFSPSLEGMAICLTLGSLQGCCVLLL
jgi:hypothetical protein